MSVLLQQAQGFEGLGVILEVVDVEDFAVANRIDGCYHQIELWTTAARTPLPPHSDAIPNIDEVTSR